MFNLRYSALKVLSLFFHSLVDTISYDLYLTVGKLSLILSDVLSRAKFRKFI